MTTDTTYQAADAYVSQCLGTFEKVLEDCGDNVTAIEALSKVPEAAPEEDSMRLRVIQFAEFVARSGNMRHAMPLLHWLVRYAGRDEEALSAIEKLNEMLQGKRPVSYADLLMVVRLFGLRLVSSKEELLERIHRDEDGDTTGPSSVLRELQERGPDEFETILVTISDDAGIPLVPLEMFHPQSTAYSSLPIEFIERRGALAFEKMGPVLLVALLNPYDVLLQAEVRRHMPCECTSEQDGSHPADTADVVARETAHHHGDRKDRFG